MSNVTGAFDPATLYTFAFFAFGHEFEAQAVLMSRISKPVGSTLKSSTIDTDSHPSS